MPPIWGPTVDRAPPNDFGKVCRAAGRVASQHTDRGRVPRIRSRASPIRVTGGSRLEGFAPARADPHLGESTGGGSRVGLRHSPRGALAPAGREDVTIRLASISGAGDAAGRQWTRRQRRLPKSSPIETPRWWQEYSLGGFSFAAQSVARSSSRLRGAGGGSTASSRQYRRSAPRAATVHTGRSKPGPRTSPSRHGRSQSGWRQSPGNVAQQHSRAGPSTAEAEV